MYYKIDLEAVVTYTEVFCQDISHINFEKLDPIQIIQDIFKKDIYNTQNI